METICPLRPARPSESPNYRPPHTRAPLFPEWLSTGFWARWRAPSSEPMRGLTAGFLPAFGRRSFLRCCRSILGQRVPCLVQHGFLLASHLCRPEAACRPGSAVGRTQPHTEKRVLHCTLLPLQTNGPKPDSVPKCAWRKHQLRANMEFISHMALAVVAHEPLAADLRLQN